MHKVNMPNHRFDLTVVECPQIGLCTTALMSAIFYRGTGSVNDIGQAGMGTDWGHG